MFSRHRHRTDAAPDSARAASAEGSKGKQLWRFFIAWVKVSWMDVILLAGLGAASQAIYTAPLASTRNFPITFTESGDIVYPEFAYPNRGWIISPGQSAMLSTLVPIAVVVLGQIRIKSFWDTNNAILGILYAVVIGTVVQVILKQLVGGYRPYFLDLCQPDLSLAASHNASGLNGVGYKSIMYTAEICTTTDTNALKNAMTSFPSGHATAAFAGFIFLFLWMNAKLKVWADHRSALIWLALLFVPLMAAVLIACSLSINQAHNWYDIIAGAVIGTVAAFASYRNGYAAIWDWRFNHIPLKHIARVDYGREVNQEHMQKAIFVRKLGWGTKRRRNNRRNGSALDKRPTNGSVKGSGSAIAAQQEARPGVANEDESRRVNQGYQHTNGVSADHMV